MKNLSHLKIKKPRAWLTKALIGNKKSKARLQKLELRLAKCLKNYDSLIHDHSEKLDESLFLDDKDLLIDYYESAPKELKKLIRDRRENHGLFACPYCGNPSIPDTLDHFIPKDHWPEFSINPNNLVPQCRGCAPTKGSRYHGSGSESAIYIHPIYADWLSNFKFRIHIDFSSGHDDIKFKASVTDSHNTNDSDVDRLKVHLINLNVSRRASLFCSRELNKLKNLLRKQKFDIETYLRVNLSPLSDHETRRDWRSALYESILAHEELIDHLKAIKPKVTTRKRLHVEREIEI